MFVVCFVFSFALQFTTPINFNNTNVVRVAPRQKLIDNNYYQQHQQHQQHEHHLQYQSQEDALKQQTTYSLQSSNHDTLVSSSSNTLIKNDTFGESVGVNNGGKNNSNGSKQRYSLTPSSSNHYNLNDCFPTSYTAYYNQQQHRQYCASNFQSGKYYTDYPYTVQNTSAVTGNTINAVNNPFVVGKKFNTDNTCRTSRHRKKPPESDNTSSNNNSNNRKFYSLKPLNQKKGLHFCSMKPSLINLTSSNGKCKRHHSFTGGSTGDVISVENYPNNVLSQNDTPQSIKMSFYEPPAYENLTDSIQIHEHNPPPTPPPPPQTTVITHHHSSTTQHKRHHQHQHQQMKDYEITSSCNLTEKERLSIYRSDSGISNSSHECITPVPAPRQLLHKNKSNTPSSSNKNKINTPHYMNISNGSSTTPTPTPTTPSTLSLPPFSSSGSESLNNASCTFRRHHNSKCNCNIDNGNSCNIHCNNDDYQINNNTNKDLQEQLYLQRQHQELQEQQELQQPTHNISHHHQSSMSHNNTSRRRKLSSASSISLEVCVLVCA